jgi:hypothetical protein
MIAASGAFGTMSFVQGHEVSVSPSHEAGLLVSLHQQLQQSYTGKASTRSKALDLPAYFI